MMKKDLGSGHPLLLMDSADQEISILEEHERGGKFFIGYGATDVIEYRSNSAETIATGE